VDVVALVVSFIAVSISAVALWWQIRRWRWEQQLHVKVEGRSLTGVTGLGERVPIVGVRVTNENPRYPIRVNAVAFTPSVQREPPTLWFSGANYELPRPIHPKDAETIDVPVEHISEVDDPLGPSFVGWIELKTGTILQADPHAR
jgi:hypothetical protein